MGRAIRTKERSSYDLVTAAIARIEQVNPQLNAVVLAIAQHIETAFGGWQPPALYTDTSRRYPQIAVAQV